MIRALYTISAAIALASNAFLLSLLFFPDSTPVDAHLWPKPVHACHGHRTIQLSKDFRFLLPHDPHPRLDNAAARFRGRILKSNFQSPVPADPSLVALENRSQVTDIKLEFVKVEIENSAVGDALELETDESYRLLIAMDEDSSAPFDIDQKQCDQMPNNPFPHGVSGIIRAKTLYGALHGMETFTQLVINNPQDGTKEIAGAPILIHDRPLFSHRGLMLDTSRNYISLSSLYRTIDAMAMNKFNVFHWHIADSQSFPIVLDDQLGNDSKSEILPLSQLAAKGAYSSDMVYSKKDIAKLVNYAMNRGIRVIPEIDMPGHAWSWSRAFPEITSCLDGYPSYSRFSAEPPSGQLNPAIPKTYEVVQGVYDQVLPLYKDKYFHAGADEVNINCWNNTDSILEYMKSKAIPRTDEGFDRILNEFVSKQHQILRRGGRTPIVWEEPLLNHKLKTLEHNKDTVIQVWTSAQNIKKTVEKGYKVITGSADYWYLDCGFGDWLGNWTMGRSWCDPYKSWQRIYSFNPISGLSPKEAKNVLGGEALLWTEQVDDTNLDVKLWPRASAVAEVLWSGNSDDSATHLWNGPDQKLDTLRSVEALDRINEHRFRMVSEKIGAEPLQPLWCVQHPGHCLWPIYDSKPKEGSY
ncbi:beta-D-N-acetylhexosaminidase 1 [Dissophora ornata]|nr:beta-D-N-acetylhexosaminidase 1 [Dissophora ornata]